MSESSHFDWVIVGSGFGGSVSALRLAEKGYRVLVLEKGKRFGRDDFPKTNWDLPRWMWLPRLGLKGIFQMSFFEHVTVLHGVGVGGGSLVYANTLPTPSDGFFAADSWSSLADWKAELEPHYAKAREMLGSTPYPNKTPGDRVLEEIAHDIGRAEHFHPTEVAVFFGEAGKEVPDPFFGGEGPSRVGCTECGACMTGCRVGAKNTLDQNYLYLAERLGARVQPESEVVAVRPQARGGYRLELRGGVDRRPLPSVTADQVVFAGGVLGTLPLLFSAKEDPDGLPHLSERLGDFVRTNNEALIGIQAPDSPVRYSDGIAITSILHTDEHSHIEPVRYGEGSDFFRLLTLPHSPGERLAGRLRGVVRSFLDNPGRWIRSMTSPSSKYATRTQILLYMRTLESTLKLRLGETKIPGIGRILRTSVERPEDAPKAFMDEANDLAERFAEKIGGVQMTLFPELLRAVPSTAHILGGCCMGETPADGVIDAQHRVHGYQGLYVIDGSAVSANPGVNPSLTITALAERAMSFVPAKASVQA